MGNSNEWRYSSEFRVGDGWRRQIEDTMATLILEHQPKGEGTSYWYKEIGLDKADASRIRRGLVLPPLWLRLKIANVFGVQSELIWRVPKIVSANELNEVRDGKD